MKKKIVLFTAAFQAYSKGDVAGFDFDTADDLISKKVAEVYDAPETETETLTISVDGSEAQAVLERQANELRDEMASREFSVKETEAALADREGELKAREDAVSDADKALAKRAEGLDAREKTIIEDEAALDKYAGELKAAGADLPNPPSAPAAGKAAASTKPPKQGGK